MSMDNVIETLRKMRGETSTALFGEIERILGKAEQESRTDFKVQVNSDLVSRGLSLLVKMGPVKVARIYLSRKEIPGFLPFRSLDSLKAIRWQVGSDSYGQEFALVWKTYHGLDIRQIAQDITSALEALGAPQKLHWELSPDFS